MPLFAFTVIKTIIACFVQHFTQIMKIGASILTLSKPKFNSEIAWVAFIR